MRRIAIVAPLLLVTLTIVFVFGIGVGGASAATLTRYQQNASQLTYGGTWTVVSSTAASGGSYRYANASGMSVTAAFNGTYLAWIGKKGPTYGIAKVTVDGGPPVNVDLYNGSAVYQQKVWETDTLGAGLHTVKIEWTGTKNAAATNTNIGVDAFDVAGSLDGVTRLEQTDQHLGWRGSWSKVSNSLYSGGTAWYANAAGSSVSIEFDGASITLLGKKGPTYGIANVTLDGGTPIPVDLYNATIVYRQVMWASGPITSGHHVVQIEWTGSKRAAATNTNVGLDALDLRGVLTVAPTSYLAFDDTRAMAHLHKLVVDIGVRHGGSPQEMQAVNYAVAHFQALGYSPQIMDVPLPDGTTSHNVVVTKPGSSKLTIVVGGHMDSYGASPGGNDNGSGSASVLELAEAIKNVDLVPTVTLVLFGHEEPMGDGNADHHHYGSRRYVALMSADQKANLAAMVSIDMVGYGTKFHVRYRERGPKTLVNMMLTYSSRTGGGLVYLKDPSTYGYSDHEAFEAVGYPVAWLEWRNDPVNHTSGDTYAHCSAAKIQQAGGLMMGFLASLRPADLQTLVAARS
jgi:Peptidase family M28